MILILFTLLYIALFKLRITNLPGELSLDETKSIKGICAITIVLVHIIQSINTTYVVSKIGGIGYLCVAYFFFFSGYGLTYNFNNKKII